MTVGELMEELQFYDEEMEVVMKPSKSLYAEDVADTAIKQMASFYGSDRDVVVLTSDQQLGAVEE